MRDYLKRLPPQTKNILILIKKLSREYGKKVYLVGGPVRDLLLGIKNLDLDIAIEAEEILDFAKALAKKLKAEFLYHEDFNTVSLNYKYGKLDLAMTRKEFYPYPGSLPKVSFGTIREDLLRRDFTINAMAVELGEEKLVDFFGGRNDLSKGLIRILHERSFLEDPTRILRAIRFKTRYDFKIEEHTLRLLKEAIKENFLNNVSRQRIFNELILSLKEEKPLKQILAIEDMLGFGFLQPRIRLDFKVLGGIENQYNWFIKKYSEKVRLWLIYLIGILDNLSSSNANSLIRFFPLKKEILRELFIYLRKKNDFHFLGKRNISPYRIYSILNPLCLEAILFLKAKYIQKNFQKNLIDFLSSYRRVSLNISGEDLKNLGIKPGPKYRQILEFLLKNKLNGKIKTLQDELNLVRERFI
ncbi:MAG: hypothetical protein N2Z79_04640 [Candidatus Omnitrophica bacterium]|nr:hypothetical protein [Candidatus Omnitrophota bacterium]